MFSCCLCTLAGAVMFHCFLGGMWYGPLFGARWMKLMKMDPNTPPESGHSTGIATNVIGGAIALYILQKVVTLHDATSLGAGAAVGVVAALFDAGMHACHPLFSKEPVGVSVLMMGYHATSYIVCGAMFAYVAGQHS